MNKQKKRQLYLKSIISGLIALAGIVSIAIDLTKDFMPEPISLAITFASGLISMYAILNAVVENFYKNVTTDVLRTDIKGVLNAFGINTDSTHLADTRTPPTPARMINDLMYVMSRCIHCSTNTRLIDGNNRLETNYYIYTLSAAHVDDQRKIMSCYLGAIVRHIIDACDGEGEIHIPVLIVPYGRNILLCEEVADSMNVPIITSQLEVNATDRFSPEDAEKDPYEHLYQTFVGVEGLEDCLRRTVINMDYSDKKIVFHGIVADCNVTRGTQAVRTARYLNENLCPHAERLGQQMLDICAPPSLADRDRVEVQFCPVTDIATLFIADENAIPYLEKSMHDYGCRLHYYFSLNEGAKKMIYEAKNHIFAYENASPETMRQSEALTAPCNFMKKKPRRDYYNMTVDEMIHTIG